MNAIRWLSVAVIPSLLLCGCSNMSNTDKGVLTGGALGAGAGALIGKATGHTGAGALIGGATGALAGGLIGNDVDNQKKQQAVAVAAAQQTQPPLALTDIVNLVHQQINDQIIINQIRGSRSVYHLTANDIEWLKANGVSDVIVGELQATTARVPRPVYVQQPVYVEPTPVVGVGVGVRIR